MSGVVKSSYFRLAVEKNPVTIICCGGVIVLSLMVTAGWEFGITSLRNMIPDAPQTAPLTALMLLLLSLSILSPVVGRNTLLAKWIGIILTIFSFLIAFWSGFQFIFSLKSNIELLLYPEEVIEQSPLFPGRPSPRTVLSTLIIGYASIAALSRPDRKRLPQILAYIGVVIPWIALFGYASLSSPFYSMPNAPETGMSPITAIGFILLSVAIMGLNPSSGLIGLLKAPTSGGFIVRILLPLAVIVPLLLSWFFNYASVAFFEQSSLNIAVSWSLTSIFMGALSIFGATIIHSRDVTRENLLVSLKNSEMRIRRIIESSPDALAIVDSNGKIIMVNSQTERLFGYTPEVLLDKFFDILIPKRFEEMHSFYSKAADEATMKIGIELLGKHKSGYEFPVDVSLSIVEMEEEIWTCCIIRDITDRKKKEEEIINLNKELEAFSYSVSHDLRAPLRSVHGFAKILEEDYSDKLDAQGKFTIETILRNALRMGTLIDDLLDFSRLGRKAIRKENIDTNALVNDILENMKRDHLNAGVAIDIVVHKLPVILGDYSLMRQVFVNLLSNAMKYSSKVSKPKIEVGASEELNRSVFYVKDNGAGFDMKYSDKLFEVFQRLHKRDDFEGTGIGLAMVKRIVEKHNGEVWAEGAVGKGATVYFSVPRVDN